MGQVHEGYSGGFKALPPVPAQADEAHTVIRRAHGIKDGKRDESNGYYDEEDTYLKKRRGPLRRSWNVLFLLIFTIVIFVLAVRFIWARAYRAVYTSTLPPKDPVGAHDGALNFPYLYPPLAHGESPSASRECQAAWDSWTEVPCHRRILSREWDNGTWMPLMTASPLRYVPQICQPECRKALRTASEEVSEKCGSSTVFNTTDYHGTFNTTWLESGPATALQVLLRRNDHSCRLSKGSGYEYCLVEMTERWGIMDGMNHANLKGIGMFLQATSERRKDPGGLKTGSRGSGSDGGWRTNYRFQVPSLSYGPGVGETDCGSCTLQWLENTLNAWQPSRIISPDTGLAISLPEHLRRLRQAGQRCESHQWNKIWAKAVQKYIDNASIAADWDNLPSGDYGWTIQNGLSIGDQPLLGLRAAKDLILAEGTPQKSPPAAHAVRCLEKLHEHLISLPCNIHLVDAELDHLARPGNHLLQEFCRDECSNAIDGDDQKLKVCRYKKIDQHKIAGPLVTAYNEAKETRAAVCRKAGRKNTLCAPIFTGLDRPRWAYQDKVPVGDIQSLVDELAQQPIPDVVKAVVQKRKGFSSVEEDTLRNKLPNWHRDLEAGACSPCVWEMVVGNGTISSAERILMDVDDVKGFLVFVDHFYRTCVDRDATWMGGLPYGGDDVIWRVQEVDGKVHRLVVDETKYSRFNNRWLRGLEGSKNYGWLRGTYGSIWHLRAAARRVIAEGKGNLPAMVALEEKHMREEDAKVWTSDEWGTWEWKGD